MKVFIDALLTKTEKVMLAKRMALVLMVEDGATDTDISNALHMSRVSVSKMRYFYEARGGGFKIALDKLEDHEQLAEFKKLLISLARYSIRAAGGRIT